MIMRQIKLLLLLVLAGCSEPIQHGRFASSGDGSLSLKSHTGSLSIMRGYALSADGQVTGPERHLIYLLIICPGLVSYGGGSQGEVDGFVSTFIYTWQARPGDVTLPVRWDRQQDTLRIAGKDYARKEGNVFVVRRDAAGRFLCQQLPSLAGDADYESALRQIRQHLSTDELIASLELQKQ